MRLQVHGDQRVAKDEASSDVMEVYVACVGGSDIAPWRKAEKCFPTVR